MKRSITILMYILTIPVGFLIEYGLASLGEPRALWLMKILGVF